MRSRTEVRKKILSLILAVMTVLNTVGFDMPVKAEGGSPQTWRLHSGSDASYNDAENHVLLFTEYLSDPSYRDPGDTLILIQHSDECFEIGDSAYQLGTASAPFNGTVRFDAMSSASFRARKALFAYLSTDASFENISGITVHCEASGDDPNNSALFADHVVNGSGGTLSLDITCVNDSDATRALPALSASSARTRSLTLR